MTSKRYPKGMVAVIYIWICLWLLPRKSEGFTLRPGRSYKSSSSSFRRMATSSSDLKKTNRNPKKRQVKTMAVRLSRAAKEAAAARKKESDADGEREEDKGDVHSMLHHKSDPNQKARDSLASISNLSKTIDEELLRPRDGYLPAGETSSMRVLLEHNDRAAKAISTTKSSVPKPERQDVAIVFGKPLWQDQITAEYASRLALLAHTMKFEDYKPALICFCGSTTPQKDNLVSETSTGVIFFRHLCAANEISLVGVDLCIIDQEDYQDLIWSYSSSSLHLVVEQLFRRHYLSTWLDQSQVCESATDEYGITREEPRKKIHVHFTLISTDYHLCNLNDIHVRSPRQSPLNSMLQELDHSVRSYRGLVETTWRFLYSPYPYVNSNDDLTVFLGKCFTMAQELRPLLVNIRGVAKQEEFFQRDNYRTLVATRRSLVTLLEEMNEAFRNNRQRKTSSGLVPPNLKAQLQKTGVKVTSNKKSGRKPKTGYLSTDVALESALLSLGRCADNVGPAGRLTSQAVSLVEWKEAIRQLERFLDLMQRACDPDRPLPASQWGKLVIDDVAETFPTTPVVHSSGLSILDDTFDDELVEIIDPFGSDSETSQFLDYKSFDD